MNDFFFVSLFVSTSATYCVAPGYRTKYAGFKITDNVFDITDIVSMLRYTLDKHLDIETVQNIQRCADYNDDGIIDIIDIVSFLQYILDKIGLAAHHLVIPPPASPPSPPPPPTVFSENVQSNLQEIVDRITSQDIPEGVQRIGYRPNAVAGIIRDGQALFATSGVKNMEGEAFEMKTIFPIASHGKFITGFMFARAIKLGYINNTRQLIRTLVPTMNKDLYLGDGRRTHDFTIRDFLDERPGFNNNMCERMDCTVAHNKKDWVEMLDAIFERWDGTIDNAPGTTQVYGSGTHFFAGYILAKIVNIRDNTSKTLDEILKTFFKPIGVRLWMIGREHFNTMWKIIDPELEASLSDVLSPKEGRIYEQSRLAWPDSSLMPSGHKPDAYSPMVFESPTTNYR